MIVIEYVESILKDTDIFRKIFSAKNFAFIFLHYQISLKYIFALQRLRNFKEKQNKFHKICCCIIEESSRLLYSSLAPLKYGVDVTSKRLLVARTR